MFFSYAPQAQVLSFDSRRFARRYHELSWMGARSGVAAEGHTVNDVWGPGSWGRTDLSPRSSVGRQAGRLLTGLDQRRNFKPAHRAIPHSTRSPASAIQPQTSSKSPASSNGSTPP